MLILALLSAAMASHSADAELRVTATVVRPLAISPVEIGGEGPVVTLRNAGAVDIQAEGATVRRTGAHIATVIPAGTEPVALTITY